MLLLPPLIPEDEEFFGRLLMLEPDFFIELERWLFIEPDLPCIPLAELDVMSEPDIAPLPDIPAPWPMPPAEVPAPADVCATAAPANASEAAATIATLNMESSPEAARSCKSRKRSYRGLENALLLAPDPSSSVR